MYVCSLFTQCRLFNFCDYQYQTYRICACITVPETKVGNQTCRQNTENAPHKQCSCNSNWTTTLCYASPCHTWRTPASDLQHVLKTTVHSPTGCDYCHLWLLPKTPCSFCPLEHKIRHDKLMSTDQCKKPPQNGGVYFLLGTNYSKKFLPVLISTQFLSKNFINGYSELAQTKESS